LLTLSQTSDYLLLGTELVIKPDGAYKVSHFENFAIALVDDTDPYRDIWRGLYHNMDQLSRVVGINILHEVSAHPSILRL
jgi:hypothetical protein